jgi:metal-sulfur cluster biosynthetic enzyme
MAPLTITELEAEIRTVLNEIVDPCSAAAGTPIGLIDMGIVRDVEVKGSVLRIQLLPTFPACRFLPIFEAEIRKRLEGRHLTVAVDVAGADVVWDESLMTPAARDRLQARRKEARAALPRPRSSPTLRALPIADSNEGAVPR